MTQPRSMICDGLLNVLGEVCKAHVALAEEGVVHGKSGAEAVVCVTAELLGVLEVIAEEGLVVGVSHLDELLGFLHGALTAQVSHAVFGDDSIDEVAGVVDMAGERHNGGDGTALGGRTAGEDAEIAVAREVSGTADAVHHLGVTDLGAVDVTVDVGLDGGVERADADAGNDLGVVGDLGGTQHELVLEEVDIIIDAFQALVGDGERAGRS